MDDGGLKGLDGLVMLLAGANGDWRLHDKLEFVWEPAWGQPPSASTLKQHMANCILDTLLAHRPRLWPRHRWTGFKAAVYDLLLLEAVHGLLTPSYRRLLRHVQPKGSAPKPPERQAPQSELSLQQTGSPATANLTEAPSTSQAAVDMAAGHEPTASPRPLPNCRRSADRSPGLGCSHLRWGTCAFYCLLWFHFRGL